jgi:ferric-dicitrate binding protein FerR (iron transport regulator)
VISLAEGKIEITHGLNSQLMTAGWITKINPQTGKLESFKGKVEDNICWVNDIILFKDASYQEVFSKLERWYGVRFVKSGKPKPGLRFNGSFKNEYLENILEHLVLKDNLTFRIDKEQVFISFN